MDDKVLWGLVVVLYVAPFACFEIYRQARRGDGYTPDRWTAWGWGGFAVLLALWSIKVPAGLVVIAAVLAGLVAGLRYAIRAVRARRAG